MADLVERIVEINRRVWDEWPVGIDAGNVEEVRRAAATAVAAALEAEASEGERLRSALTTALALIDDYLAYRHDGDPWSEDARLMGEMEMNYADKDGRLTAIRLLASNGAALIPEAPVREGWMPIETAPKDGREVLITDGDAVGAGFYDDAPMARRANAGWFWEDDRANLLIAKNAGATHWMPLPAPPQDNREG